MKKIVLIALILALGIVTIARAGAGELKLSPAWPVMLSSPATFQTWVQGGASAYELHILVVMTEDCYNALTGPVTLTGPGPSPQTIPKAEFTPVTLNSAEVPPGYTAKYMCSSLKDHLDEGLSVPLSSTDTIYYHLEDAPLTEPLKGTQEFVVTVPSSNLRVLIYVMGAENDGSADLDMRVPPTKAGFMVPEPATIAAVATSIGAFGLYAYHKKRKP